MLQYIKNSRIYPHSKKRDRNLSPSKVVMCVGKYKHTCLCMYEDSRYHKNYTCTFKNYWKRTMEIVIFFSSEKSKKYVRMLKNHLE